MYEDENSLITKLCQCMGNYSEKENKQVMECFAKNEIYSINNDILHICGQEWYSLKILEPDYNCPQIKEALEKLKITMRKCVQKSNIVIINDPRISLLLPLWKEVLEEFDSIVSYIWVYDNPLEISDVLRKRNGFSRKHSLLLWANYNLAIMKFLKGKNYLQISNRDIVEKFKSVEMLGRLFECDINNDLKCVIEYMIQCGRGTWKYSVQDVKNAGSRLFADIYIKLLENQDLMAEFADLEKRYIEEVSIAKASYIDYEAINNFNCLEKKEIIIYGAGNLGKETARMLSQLKIHNYDFCDKDIHKHGTTYMDGSIFSMEAIEARENLCVIIAVEKEDAKREIEETVSCISGVEFLSFFAVKMLWRSLIDKREILVKMDSFSSWHRELFNRICIIRNACKCSILVYQCGKVGSVTLSAGLQKAGIENAHVHDFFFKTDRVGELVIGDEGGKDFVKKFNTLHFQNLEYIECIKEEMKGKKIITLVRDPIAVDLSLVFQWMGRGILDKYFAKQIKEGKTFLEIVLELMLKNQDRVFNWFNQELKVLSGIDVFAYPFDKEKGYALISENDIDVLVLKTEKLSQMTEIIRKFTGNHKVELVNKNVGENKGYMHMYKEVKKRLDLPEKYVEHYYKNNPYMDHFYSEEEKKAFLMKWAENVTIDFT